MANVTTKASSKHRYYVKVWPHYVDGIFNWKVADQDKFRRGAAETEYGAWSRIRDVVKSWNKAGGMN